MRTPFALAACAAIVLSVAGCGGGQQQTTAEPSPSPAAPVAAAVDSPTTPSQYDSGPRAGEASVNATLAATGEQLFTTKICATCHKFGERFNCPDLRGVTMRRTHEWMKEQIMHPDVMVKEDILAWRARQGFPAPMPNQNLTEEQANALIEYIKQQDKKAGAAGGS